MFLRFIDGKFYENYVTELGIDFTSKMITVNDEVIKLIVCDTAGMEIFHNFTSDYYKGACGCLVVFDISDRLSFERVC